MCTDACRKRITCPITRVTVFYQQIQQIHGFTIDYGKFKLTLVINNQINARALIGQSSMIYCAGKLMAKSRVF